jgi:hypothetical protein
VKPIPDAYTDYSIGDNGNQFPPKTMLRFITCIPHYTQVFCPNYFTWKCGHCGWYPGSCDGPPNIRCGSCGFHHYTDDPEEATALILVTRTDWGGYGLKILGQLGRLHERESFWRRLLGKGREEFSICVGESK